MKCPKCQFENREGVKFCEKCGLKLELICPKCRAKIPPDRFFCGECGYNLKEPTESPFVDYSKPQSYTPKHLKEKILTNRSSIEGERKLVTVFFADVTNYTSLSEKMDPEEVHQIMDGCFKILTDEIHKYEGTINQFTGDGVMALFGAPVSYEDHAQRACHAALSIQKKMNEYGEKIKKDRRVEFKMRIGLNSGQVIVGSIGDDLRMDYTAVGDTTNMASRMQGLAEPGTVLISRETHRLVRAFFEFKPVGQVEVKGKDKLQEAFELIKTSGVDTRIRAAESRGLTKFVGRRNSMASLMEAWEKAKIGSGQIVGIVGEAGVGKSRLLLEFRSRFSRDEVTYLEGSCLHYGGSMAYLPILDIIKSYFDLSEEDQESARKNKIKDKILELEKSFKGVIAPLEELLSLKVGDEEFLKLEPKQKREKTFEAIRDLLIRESQNKPLILALEDLHWIDKTTEEFLNYLIGWIVNTPTLLILLYRPEYTHQWGSKSYYTQIGLNQLGAESSAELVQAILEGGKVASDLRELVLNRAAGNPLFMEEFTYTLLENGSIQKKDDRFVLRLKTSEIQVPDTIQGIIAARMDRLEDDLKQTMQVASVIGREFAFRLIQKVIEMREDLKAILLNLQGLEFIYEKSLFPELEYIFKHALTQEVAYNSLLHKRRKEIHENIGRAIEEIYVERLEEFYEMLAYHYSKSGNQEKAFHFLRLSGEKATKNYSNSEALQFFKDALTVLKKQPETLENKKLQIEVIFSLLNSLGTLGFPEDPLKVFQEWLTLINAVGDENSLFYYYNKISEFYTYKGELPTAIKYLEDSCQAANRLQNPEFIIRSATTLVWPYIMAGQFHKVIELTSRTIDLVEKEDRKSDLFGGRTNAYTQLCGYHARALGNLGHFDDGKVFSEKAVHFAANILGLGISELSYAIFLRCQGDGCRIIEHARKSIQYFEEANYFALLGFAWLNLGWGYYFSGDLELAENHTENGLEIQKDTGVELSFSVYFHLLSIVYCDSGDLEKAQNCAEKALEISKKNNQKDYEGLSNISLGKILGKKNPSKVDRPIEYIQEGIRILEDLKARPLISQGYLFLGELYAYSGQRVKALENLRKAEAEFKDMGMGYYLASTYAAYSNKYIKENDQSKARENLKKAIEIFMEIDADGWVVKYEKDLSSLS